MGCARGAGDKQCAPGPDAHHVHSQQSNDSAQVLSHDGLRFGSAWLGSCAGRRLLVFHLYANDDGACSSQFMAPQRSRLGKAASREAFVEPHRRGAGRAGSGFAGNHDDDAPVRREQSRGVSIRYSDPPVPATTSPPPPSIINSVFTGGRVRIRN